MSTIDRLATAADKATRLLHEAAEHDIGTEPEVCDEDGCREVNLALAEYQNDVKRVRR